MIDTRRRDSDENWQVRWGCIKPVPDKISFARLFEELKAQTPIVQMPFGGVRKMSFERHILCHGVPGQWRIGLEIGNGYPYVFESAYRWSGRLVRWPIAGNGVRTLEEGFALLLRDMRARRFNPYTHSKYGEEQLIAQADCRPKD